MGHIKKKNGSRKFLETKLVKYEKDLATVMIHEVGELGLSLSQIKVGDVEEQCHKVSGYPLGDKC